MPPTQHINPLSTQETPRKVGQWRDQGGFTLLEMVVALGVTAVVSVFGYAFFINAFNFSVMHDRTADMQQKNRIGIDVLAREIQNSGLGVVNPLTGVSDPAGAPFGSITAGNNVDPDPDGNAGVLDRITIGGGLVSIGQLAQPALGGTNQVVVAPLVGVDPTNPSLVGRTITLDGFLTRAVTAVAKTGSNYTLTLAVTLPALRDYSTANEVLLMQTITYRVAVLGGEPVLLREVAGVAGLDDQVIAFGIEDFQVAYLLRDGLTVNNPVSAVENPNGSTIRGVRVSMLARARDVGVQGAAPGNSQSGALTGRVRPVLEDHAAGVVPDNFRRRLITRVVEVRNAGLFD